MDIEPIQVWDSISTKRTLNTVEGCALWMLNRWPPDHDRSLLAVAARTAALQALEGTVTPEGFRTAFLMAAEEADVLAPADPTPRNLPGHVARPWDFQKKRKRR